MQRDPYAGIARPEDDEEDPYAGIARMEDGERRNNRFQIARRATYDFMGGVAEGAEAVPFVGAPLSSVLGGVNEIALGDRTRSATPNASGGLAHGFSGFLSDELQGVAAAGVQPLRSAMGEDASPGDAYRAQTDAARADLARAKQENPILMFGVEAAGAALNPLTYTGAGWAGRGANIFGRGVRAGAVAAPGAAVYGAGGAEGGLAERGMGAAISAAFAAPAGFAGLISVEGLARGLGVGVNQLGRLYNRVRNGGDNLTPDERQAWNYVSQQLNDAGLSADDVNAQFRRWEDAGYADDFVFELSPNLRGDAEGLAADLSNVDAQRGVAALRERQSQASARVLATSRATLGDDGGQFISRHRAAIENRRVVADEAYSAFRAQAPQRGDVLVDWFESPSVRQATTRVVRGLQDDRLIDQGTADLLTQAARNADGARQRLAASDLPPAVFLAFKQELSDQAERAASGQARRLYSRAADIDDWLRGTFGDVYEAANDTYAQQSRVIDLFDEGRLLMRGTENRRMPELTAEAVAQMNPQELEAFRYGLARGILESVREAKPGVVQAGGEALQLGASDDVAQRIFARGDQQELLRAAFGDEQQFALFARSMQNEMRRASSRNAVDPDVGSRSQRSLRSQANVSDAQAATELARAGVEGQYNPLEAISRLVGVASDGNSTAFNRELARILFSTPAQARPMLEMQLRDQVRRELVRTGASQLAINATQAFARPTAGLIGGGMASNPEYAPPELIRAPNY